MKTRSLRNLPIRWTLASLVSFAAALSLNAQQAAPAAPAPAEEPIIELSPFEVDASGNSGYYAANTLMGSRMNTKVSDLAASITVVTLEQMEDTGSIDMNDVFRYEANTEGAETYTPAVQSLRNDGVVDLNSGFTHGADGQSQTVAIANRVRGIGQPTTTLNYYPSNAQVPFDAYNIQSVEINRGPNSMLFGMGSPAGIVNQTNSMGTINKDSTRVGVRFDDRGSYRGSLSFNRTLIQDKLAVFGAALYDNRQFERKPSYDKTTRFYGAATYKPLSKTKISAGFEWYDNDNRRPNTLTPRDAVTPWRQGGGWGYDPSTGTLTQSSTGKTAGPLALRSGSPRIEETRAYIESLPNYNADLWNGDRTKYNGVNIYGGVALTDANSVLQTPGMWLGNDSRPKIRIADGNTLDYLFYRADRYRLGYGTAANPAANAPQWGSDAEIFADPVRDAAYNTSYSQSGLFYAAGNGIGSYRYPGVTDQSIYDWTSVNLLEMNFGDKENKTFNIEFEQELLPEVNLSAGWFRQDFASTTNYTVSQLNVATLFVDTNTHTPQGEVNPYFGQPYLESPTDPDQFVIENSHDSGRVMLAWTPDFTENDGWSKWLGRHQILGLLSTDRDTGSFWRKRWYITSSEEGAKNVVNLTKNPNNNADGSPTGYNLENRSVQRIYYVGSAGGTPDGSVKQSSGEWNNMSFTGQLPYFNWDSRTWEPLQYTTEYIDHSAHTGRSQRQVDSYSAGITSHWWDDRIVTTFGIRRDDYKARATTNGAILDQDGNQVAPGMTNQEKWVNGYYQTETIFNRWNRWDELSGDTSTIGAVIRPFERWDAIDNEFISSLGFSYNRSDNFNPPTAAQVDVFGTPLPKPTGEGEDYGIQFSLFQNKLFARFNWFKMTNDNERTNPGTSISRMNGNVDTDTFRNWARTIAKINMGMDPIDSATFNATLSEADEQAVRAATEVIWQQPYTYYEDIGSVYATRSAEAEGMEVQITYNPTSNWTMKFTGGKQETVYANVMKEFDAWFDHRDPVWSGARAANYLKPEYQSLATYTNDAGRAVNLVDFWNSYGYASTVTGEDPNYPNVQAYWDDIVNPQVAIAKELEGQASPGQRRYHYTYLTSYNFTEGALEGFGVGGAVRWEDKAIIGYYGRPNPGTGSDDLVLADVDRPIWDDARTYVDFWVSYTTRFGDGSRLKLQLNVVDVFESGGLQPVSVNYDGSESAFRIVDPRQFILSATFDF
ncbi:MAG: TonB-dependent receptor [Opitutaceae bacterium]